MTILSNSVTYQGLPLEAVEFRRSDGLNPERGTGIIDYKYLKELKLQSIAVPWRGVQQNADGPGAVSIKVATALLGNATRANFQKSFEPPTSGFKLFGPLIFTTVFEGGETKVTRFEDIYIDNVEEVEMDLALAQTHKEGKCRIEFSDIRQFYGRYGTLIQRINCRMKSGKYDPRTVKKVKKTDDRGVGSGSKPTITTQSSGEEPWSFDEVMRYLFGQLPGSPNIILKDVGAIDAPEEIDSIGSPVASVIEDLLRVNGLVAKMQPDGSYLICRWGMKFLGPGEVIEEVDGAKIKPIYIAGEKKSVTFNDVPPVVMVLGRRRIRRRTLSYVAVFEDTDGKIYRLSDIDKVWEGYSFEAVCTQATLGAEKNFQDVPPKLFGRTFTPQELQDLIGVAAILPGAIPGLSQKEAAAADEDRGLHFRRREIMRSQAFKMYAPDLMFGENAPQGKGGAPFMSDRDHEALDFLPMTNAPYYEHELKRFYPGKAEKKRGSIFLVPPVVRGSRTGQVFYPNFLEASQHLRQLISMHEADIDDFFPRAFATEREKLKSVGEIELRADKNFESGAGLDSKLAREAWGAAGIDVGATSRVKSIIDGLQSSQDIKARAKQTIQNLEAMLDMENATVSKYKKELRALALTFANEGGIHLLSNMPYGQIPQGTYELEGQSGLLRFQELVCTLYPPLVFDGNSAIVVRDGNVSVTFGHEVNINEVSDFTSVMLTKGGVCGINVGSPIKPHVIHDPDLQMYEDDIGFPMNLDDCIAQAKKKAGAIVEQEVSSEGFSNQYDGFVKCALERSVVSIQYVWDHDTELAYTYVSINAPGARLPLGPGDVPKRIDVITPSNQARKRAEG